MSEIRYPTPGGSKELPPVGDKPAEEKKDKKSDKGGK